MTALEQQARKEIGRLLMAAGWLAGDAITTVGAQATASGPSSGVAGWAHE